jgi:hypothetical protein
MVTAHSWPGLSASAWKNLWSGSQTAIASCSNTKAARHDEMAGLQKRNWRFAKRKRSENKRNQDFCASTIRKY